MDDEGDLAGVVAGGSYVEGLVRFCCGVVWMVGHADVEPVERIVVYDRNNLVRGDGVDERFGLHVRGDCDECQWDWCRFGGVGGGDTVDGAGCSDFSERDWRCERFVGCVVDCAGQ